MRSAPRLGVHPPPPLQPGESTVIYTPHLRPKRVGRAAQPAEIRVMPKMKTKSAAKRRFRLTATGKVRFNSAYRRHRLISKDKSAKERNQGTKVMCEPDARKVRRFMLPNG